MIGENRQSLPAYEGASSALDDVVSVPHSLEISVDDSWEGWGEGPLAGVVPGVREVLLGEEHYVMEVDEQEVQH